MWYPILSGKTPQPQQRPRNDLFVMKVYTILIDFDRIFVL